MIAELDSLYIKTRPRKAYTRLISHLFFQGRFLTSNHRWLNSFLRAEMTLAAALPQLKSVRKPIFIIGMGRSGSTILGKTLSMHREVGFLNEPKLIWFTVDSRDDINGNFSQGLAQFRLTADDALPERKRTIERIYGFYCAATGATRIVDKYPEMIFRIPYLQELFPDARFVFLVRNGWDSIYSVAAWSKRNSRRAGGIVEDWWGTDRRKWKLMVDQLVSSHPLLSAEHRAEIAQFIRHEDMAAVEWTLSSLEGLEWLKRSSDIVHLIRYENLTEKPTETLKALLGFCELSDDSIFLDYARQTLVPGRTHNEPTRLSPAIQPLFLQTMAEFGYPASAESKSKK